jgi:20S proteasome alpha/beta subunit
MTIILAVPAKDGLVLASDGQITYADGIRAPGKKIFKLNKKCLWAASGRGALIQRVAEQLTQLLETESSLELIRDSLAKTVKKCAQELFQLDQQPPQDSFVFVQYLNQPRILQISVSGTPEWITTGPFSIGIGRMFAHALLQKYTRLFPDKIDVQKASLLAFKIIEEAIQVGAFGLGPPIDIWAITKDNLKNLSEEEISGLADLSQALRGTELDLLLNV